MIVSVTFIEAFQESFLIYVSGKIQIVITAKSGKVSCEPKLRLIRSTFLCIEIHLIF